MNTKVAEIAKRLLKEGKVKLVIGYARPNAARPAIPFFARTEEEASKLVFDETCTNNLAVYLTRKFDFIKGGPVAIVAKGCDAKSIAVLLQEHQLARENIFIIGVPCNGVKSDGKVIDARCNVCDVKTPLLSDELAGEPVKSDPKPMDFSEVAKIDNMSTDERFMFWAEEFERCVKCYACQSACPLCYCERCIVEKNRPQWVKTSAHQLGNLEWHITRAFHLAGRCTGCGACERACHQEIPLRLLNMKMGMFVAKTYNYRSGYAFDTPPVFASWKLEDDESFIG